MSEEGTLRGSADAAPAGGGGPSASGGGASASGGGASASGGGASASAAASASGGAASAGDGAPRAAEIRRTTGETDVTLSLRLDGTGRGTRATGVGFFDHLLDAVARHGGLDLDVAVTGDLETGPHHTVEDTGLALGRALDEALGDRAGIVRFGHAVIPMDEARASCALDVSGRPFLAFDGLAFPAERVGDFDTDLAAEFMRAVATTAKLTLHLSVEAGTNTHHMVEATFKAFARALRAAVAHSGEDAIPSTKGVL